MNYPGEFREVDPWLYERGLGTPRNPKALIKPVHYQAPKSRHESYEKFLIAMGAIALYYYWAT